VVDSASFERIEAVKNWLPKSIFVINIDHHTSNPGFGDLNWVDPHFSSTGEMIFELIKSLRVKIDRDIATNIYVAILTDTGRFSFSNTKPESLLRAAELIKYGASPSEIAKNLWRMKDPRQIKLLASCADRIRYSKDRAVAWLSMSRVLMKRCGFIPTDTQEYVELVKSIKGVKVAILFRETETPRRIKISFRTEAGVDGERLAKLFGGGGHPRAAGATLKGTLKNVQEKVLGHVFRELKNLKIRAERN
jgi:phosphoesterase RecJ-like protein